MPVEGGSGLAQPGQADKNRTGRQEQKMQPEASGQIEDPGVGLYSENHG